MKSLVHFMVLCALLTVAASTHPQQVIRFKPRNAVEAEHIMTLANQLQLDVWSENRAIGQFDVRFHTVPYFEVAERFHSIPSEVMIEDVQNLIHNSLQRNLQARQSSVLNGALSQSDDSFFKSYHSFDEILDWMNNTAASYPYLTRLEQIGSTVQGNPIIGIHIRSSKGGPKKPLIVYNSLQHAREWISGATTTYIINQLVTGYGKADHITKMVDSIDWFIVPVVNADGYLWTWNPSGDRLWRKNRRPLSAGCYGIDINRNWGFHFKADPAYLMCQETYAGTVGFSEPENKAIADFLAAHPTTVGYIDFHSYSQLMMWPWAWQAPPPPHNSDVVGLGNKMVDAIASVNGIQYTGGQIYEVIYPAYGSSVDFALGVANVTLPYGIELRDTGEYGFLLPPEQIIPNGKEIFSAVETMASYIIDNNIRR